MKVARIGRPHGVRGESTLQVFTDNLSRRLAAGQELVATTESYPDDVSACLRLVVASMRRHHDASLVRFEGVGTRDEAQKLRDINLFAEVGQRDGSDEDAWYEHELLDFEVHDQRTRSFVGTVTALRVLPAQDLLVVKTPEGKEVMIPFVKQLVLTLDRSARRVTVSLPPGLFDI